MTKPKPSDLKKARKLLEKMERFSLAGEATGTVGFDSEGNTVCYSESNLNTLAQAISEARREEGEIVHKQMDAIMDKAIERARSEEMERCIKIADSLSNGLAGSAIRQAIEDLP